jgi:hypothetical protein
LLARCNLKHDVVEEAISVTTAGRVSRAARAERRPPGGRHHRAHRALARRRRSRLVVTGKTNLPPRLLGLRACTPTRSPVTRVALAPDSPFAGPAWEAAYPTGYAGHQVNRVEPAPGSRVLADLAGIHGRSDQRGTATVSALGPGIVLTDRTAYVANQVFELLGGMLQAHLNVEAVRHWANPTHWGDTILFFLRRVLRDVGLDDLWQTRLRSFGTHDGVLSFRHDVHGMLDFNFLDYQIQNLIPPATTSRTRPSRPISARRWPRNGWRARPGTASSSRRSTTTARSATRRRRSTAPGSIPT